jgi:hypothetical protein
MFIYVLAVPADFDSVLEQYTERGYRVIGLAWKPYCHEVSENDVPGALVDIQNTAMCVLCRLLS